MNGFSIVDTNLMPEYLNLSLEQVYFGDHYGLSK